jgi:hypothetical protein
MTVTTVEGLCNQVLDIIGYKGRRIGSIWDGTEAAKAALENYSQTRDELLNLLNPYWAQRQAVLTLLNPAPVAYPITGWTAALPPLDYAFEYVYPTDCIQPQYILPTPLFRPIWRPRFISFDIFSRLTAGVQTRTIVTNCPNAILVYTGRITDPNLWQDDFTVKFLSALSEKMKAKLGVAPVEQHPNNPS